MTPNPDPTPILSATVSGSREDQLRELHKKLAIEIEKPTTPPRDLAPLVRQYVQITEILDGREDKSEGTLLETLLADHASKKQT